MTFNNINLISRRSNKMKSRINLTWFLAMIVIVVGMSNAQPGMLFELYQGGTDPVAMLTETSAPDLSEIVPLAEWGIGDPDGDHDNYAARLTGYIIPPVTGNYTFWLNTDDNGRLWLSTDADPANAALIATETGYSGVDSWAAVGDEEVSAPIALVGGNLYWIRAGYQEGGGGDHVQIGWASPEAGIDSATVIGGSNVLASLPDLAYNPSPADGEFIRYSTDATELMWSLPPSAYDANDTGLLAVECDVLFYTVDPVANPGATPVVLVDHLTDGRVESVQLNGLADAQAHYWWQVDVFDPNGDDIMMREGDVWTFSSARDVPMVFIDETDGSTTISEVDPTATDDYVITLSMDPGVPVEITVYTPTNTLETVEADPGDDAAKLIIGYDGTGTAINTIVGEFDDSEQDLFEDGRMDRESSDLEFFNDGSSEQIIACLFLDVDIPQGATIDSARVDFQIDETENTGEVYGIITGENVDNAAAIANTAYTLTDRFAANPTTATSTFAWTDDYAVGDVVPTGDISSVIQEIVNRPGWTPLNDILLFFTEDPYPDPVDIEFVGGSRTYVLDSSNWDTGVTVTIKAVDDADLEVDPDVKTLISTASSTDPAWDGLPVSDVIVGIDENECGSWGFIEPYDINRNCFIDLGDLAMIAAEWLTCTTPNTGTCIDLR